jgi:hypothetical protein
MAAVNPISSRLDWSSPKWTLVGIIEQLIELQNVLSSAGLRDEVGSLRTVIADLCWQCEEMESV